MAFDLIKPHSVELRPGNVEFLARRARGEGLLIGGAWGKAEGGADFATLDPATGIETGRIAAASASDVDAAVAAARGGAQSSLWMLPRR